MLFLNLSAMFVKVVSLNISRACFLQNKIFYAFQEILEWLNNTKSEAGVSYRKFMRKHGHRCLKEVRSSQQKLSN